MELVNELIKGLLPEEENKQTTALYAGGFKPPTSGHFEVVEQALKQNPEIDELIIFVGAKDRDGISQTESLLIWDIYKQYLPFKVTIQPSSKSPIGDVYSFAKEHPTREILWVIGAREGNEEDFKDVTQRTSRITKYPNLELRTIVTSGGVSGTAARNAAKVSFEKFEKFVPDVLSDEEKKEVYGLISGKVQEEITKPQLNAVEKVADSLFRRLGIDVEFTKHFLDRLNDKRNGKPISGAELIGIFKRLYKYYGKTLSRIDKDMNAVVKDLSSFINIPLAIDVQPNEIDLVAKTIMRKKDFKTSTPVYNINENASYTQNIDIKKEIANLTKHMFKIGLNIQPLPKLIFKHGDSENAKEFLGKTAYYDPNTQTIVLYTEGRHPKDVVRSYSHEMIHHIQNLEDRLGNVQGTNTMEDDHLNQIEQEANLMGTMTFRNWTDSLNEKKNKDPFGINAYAMELGRLREEEDMKYQIYCDMDGVLADFERGYEELTGIDLSSDSRPEDKEFWDPISKAGVKFWAGLKWMSDGQELWNYIKPHTPKLLSAPSREESSRIGKYVWVKHKIPGTKLILRYANKKKELASPTSILIDDRKANIDSWEVAGGIGILHTSTANTIKELKKLGL